MRYAVFKPTVHHGIITSGDKFISNPGTHKDLSYQIGSRKTLATEMEGAAIAQVCHEHHIPYTIIRTISDKANHSAALDFQAFVTQVASKYSSGILNHYFEQLEGKNTDEHVTHFELEDISFN